MPPVRASLCLVFAYEELLYCEVIISLLYKWIAFKPFFIPGKVSMEVKKAEVALVE